MKKTDICQANIRFFLIKAPEAKTIRDDSGVRAVQPSLISF